MTDPADMIVPLLREMRAENVAQHEQTRAMIAVFGKRLGHVFPDSAMRELEGHK